MAEDSVIFEMQVERKILEKVLNNNQQMQDVYILEATIHQQKHLVSKLELENQNLRSENAELSLKLKENSPEMELTKLKELFAKIYAEKNEMEFAKAGLETKCKELEKKLQLQEMHANSHNLEQVESKILKLKLQNVENEKKYLLADIEHERKIIERQSKPRIAKLEENIKMLRRWIDKEKKERFPRESQEVKALKEKIATLEKDKADLIEGFELERKVFRKILKANNCNEIVQMN